MFASSLISIDSGVMGARVGDCEMLWGVEMGA